MFSVEGVTNNEKKRPTPLTRERKDSTSSSETPIKVPHTPRFAEATSVCSPNEANKDHRSPFADPPSQKTQSYMAQAQPSDIGFAAPLKSTIKAPGTPERKIDNPLSPTFREEQLLEKYEQGTEKEQAKDLKIKTRVRVAKFVLRAPRNNFPPWAQGQKTWPQITVLVITCISLAFCLLIFWNYWRGGHWKAEKVAVYSTLFAVGFFIFSIVMWTIAAVTLQQPKNSGHGKDMWGWSCVHNDRRDLFQEDVDYVLVCKMQNWSLVCCLIEIVLECITVILYGIVFYRYYSKQRLRKSMDVRDRARSDLYLAQLGSQSAPNKHGFDPMSPSYSTHAKSPHFPPSAYNNGPDAKEGFAGAQFVKAKSSSALNTKSFALQLPPIKTQSAMPKVAQNCFERAPSPPVERRIEHVSAAPGEQTYDAVPIPGAYASPLSSPGLAQPQHQ
ncbi:hypothetical protein BKA65DRAFT_531006 [Rhexocercosporidium sp. MPI-PUGE-AT-0058]|nr:hypothetical protein BKA65DRAFT_531006 [Rhexocercosporidium sp. MPI-PUGE-AT-0058]